MNKNKFNFYAKIKVKLPYQTDEKEIIEDSDTKDWGKSRDVKGEGSLR